MPPSDLADVADDSYGSVGDMKRILLYWNKKFRSILEESREYQSITGFYEKVPSDFMNDDQRLLNS